jgi:hypothetical protein
MMRHDDGRIDRTAVDHVVCERCGARAIADRNELGTADGQEAALRYAGLTQRLELDLWKLGERRARGRHGQAS